LTELILKILICSRQWYKPSKLSHCYMYVLAGRPHAGQCEGPAEMAKRGSCSCNDNINYYFMCA